VLTEAGRELRGVLDAMSIWGERWSDTHPHESDLHPMTTVCMLRARCRGSALPLKRVVVEMVTRAPKHSRSWLVLENGIASLCDTHPGFDVDLLVTTDVHTLYQIWLDQLSIEEAVSRRLIEIEGDRSLARGFPGWFGQVDAGLQEHFEASVPH
jgi:hypothetical protein